MFKSHTYTSAHCCIKWKSTIF